MNIVQAIRYEDTEFVEKLLASGAHVHARDPMGYTALHVAAWRGNKGLLKLLIKAGADMNARGPWGVTPLMLAANTECANMLVEAGADRSVRDYDGNLAALPS